jgi:hypothetical protein
LVKHFFFFVKRKPVLKEKKKTCFFSQAFFLRKVCQGFYYALTGLAGKPLLGLRGHGQSP